MLSVTGNEAFRECSPSRKDLFETAVFLLSCGRVKEQLFESADVTAQIYYLSEHPLGSLGSHEGMLFTCLFYRISNIETSLSSLVTGRFGQISNFECRSVFLWTGKFSKTLHEWTQIFFYMDKKDAFSKRSGYVLTWPKILRIP